MGRTRRVLVRAIAWPVIPVLLVGTGVVQVARPLHGGPLLAASDVLYVVVTAACWLAGVLLTGRASAAARPAGWAVLGLGAALAWSGLVESYSRLARADGSDAPAGSLAATLSDTSFVWCFVFLALVLWLAPPVRPTPPRRSLPRWVVAAGAVYQLASLLRSSRLDPPYADTASPWAVGPLHVPMALLAGASVFSVGLCLVWTAVELGRRRATT